MREQPALAVILVPFGEIIGVAAVLARPVMLEPDAAEFVGKREQKFIAVVVAHAEQRDGFGHQRGVARDMVGAGGEIFLLVGDDVERHAVAERPGAEISAREHRAVDQIFVAGDAEAVAAARHLEPVERGGAGPAVGQDDLGLHGDLAGEPASGIEAHLFPLDVHHRRGDDDAAFGGARRRQEVEGDVDALHPLRHLDVEGVDVGRLARPDERLAARAGAEPRDLGDRPARGVLAGQPFGIEEGEFTRPGHRDRLADAEDAAGKIGRIDAQQHRARKRPVGGERDGERLHHGLRAAVALLCMDGGGGRKERSGDQGGCDEACFFHDGFLPGNRRSHNSFSPCGRRIRSLATKWLGAVG